MRTPQTVRVLVGPVETGPVTTAFYRGLVEHYAEVVRAEPGLCWWMVSRGPGFRTGSPTDCPEPVRGR